MIKRKHVLLCTVAICLASASCFVFASQCGFFSVNAEASSAAGGTTLYVGGSGPGNYTSIQDAIDNASAGDTVYVFNGTYYENIQVNKTITLVGENRDGAVIDGGGHGNGNAINVSAADVTILRFSIRRARDGVWVDTYAQHTVITNCTLYNLSGAGVELPSFPPVSRTSLETSPHRIANCTIYNTGWGIGASPTAVISNCEINMTYIGVGLQGSTYSSIRGCTIRYSQYGIRLLPYFPMNPHLPPIPADENEIVNCEVHGNDDGVWLSSSLNNSVRNCDIHGNGHGLQLTNATNNTVQGCYISGNGDSVYLDATSDGNVIAGSTICNNSDGLYLKSSSECIITNVIAINNSDYGIAIFTSSNITLTDVNAGNNSVNGVHLQSSYNCTVIDAIACNNDDGIEIGNSTSCTITRAVPENNSKNGVDL